MAGEHKDLAPFSSSLGLKRRPASCSMLIAGRANFNYGEVMWLWVQRGGGGERRARMSWWSFSPPATLLMSSSALVTRYADIPSLLCFLVSKFNYHTCLSFHFFMMLSYRNNRLGNNLRKKLTWVYKLHFRVISCVRSLFILCFALSPPKVAADRNWWRKNMRKDKRLFFNFLFLPSLCI